MANKIQNFDTGEKDNSNIIHLDLDPKINIENKMNTEICNLVSTDFSRSPHS